MNKDIFAGKWKQFKGEIQTQWGKLTDDDLEAINGDIEKLVHSASRDYLFHLSGKSRLYRLGENCNTDISATELFP